MKYKPTSRSVLTVIVLVLTLGSPVLSHMVGTGILPAIRAVKGALGPNNNLGIDCALGASADSPNPFPTPISTKDSDGVIDSTCQWAGDVDGDPAGTLDPLTSDNPEALTPQIGGGFIADVIFTNMNNTINGFDITLNYDPHILDFAAFDQSGLTFGGNVGCPAANPQCTLTLTNNVDRAGGVIRLAQVLLATAIGPNGSTGNINSVTLFRLRFDVVGSGFTSIDFGTNIITFSAGANTGPDPHFTINGSFSTQDLFNLLNSQPLAPSTAWFNISWTSSPNPEIPGNPLTFTATASCSYCLGTLTYNWDFSSVDLSTYTPKIDRTGNTVTVTAPPPIVNRITLTITNGTASASATRRLLLEAAAPSSTLPIGSLGSAARGSWLGGVSTYSGSYNLCPAQSATDFSVCTQPKPVIPLGTATQNKTVTLSYRYAGIYNSTLSITDSAPTQVNGPNSASATFPVNVTGFPSAFNVGLVSNSSTVAAHQTLQFVSTISYNNTFPTTLRAGTFLYTFSFGDGNSQTLSSGPSATVLHTYASGGNFTVNVTAQENRASSQARIREGAMIRLGGNQGLAADFTINPASPQIGQTVSFNAIVSGGTPPDVFAWNFGDGSTTSGNPATHSYTRSGTFMITLTVTDAQNHTASVVHNLVVTSPTGGATTVGVWNNKCNSFNVTNANPSCATSGLTLSPKAQFIVQINITNAPPFNAFEFALYYDPQYLTAVSIDATGSTGTPTVFGSRALLLKSDLSRPGVVYVAATGLGQAGVFNGTNGVLTNIVFNITGTGVSPLTLATGMIPSSFDFDANGQRPDSTDLAETNSAGQTFYIGVMTSDGYFTNVAGTGKLGPVSNFTFSPTPTSAGQTVSFNSSMSFDPDNRTGRGINLYIWDFGDGSSIVTNQTFATHDYVSAGGIILFGNFSVRLTVIDLDNKFEGMRTRLLTILQPSDEPPTASFTFSPSSPMAKQVVTFDASSSNDPDGTIVTYTWNFGDGPTFSTGNNIITHAYQNPGNFTVSLTVIDSAARSGVRSS